MATDSILEARETTIAAIINVCYELINCYGSDHLLCRAVEDPKYGNAFFPDDVRRECDALVFGSLVLGLRRLGIWPQVRSSNDYHGSVSALVAGLRTMHCFALDERDNDTTEHRVCKFTLKLQQELDRIEKNILPLGVHESHIEHMKEQARK